MRFHRRAPACWRRARASWRRTKTDFGLRWLVFFIACVGADAAAKPPAWERQAFPLPESIWSVEAIDAKPGEPRELIAMGVTKVFALSEPAWTPRVLFDAVEGKMLYCVALDVNRDGATDLALGRYQIPWIEFRQGKMAAAPKGPDFSVAWIENTRDRSKPWPMHVLDRELNGIHGLCVGDVDGDGHPDVISDSISGPAFPNSVAWFKLGHDAARATRHIITRDGADGRPHYLEFADVNGDGRGDVLLGDSGAGTFTWWQRGTGGGERWTKHRIAQEKGATNVRVADVNGDGHADVIGSCGHGVGVFWFEGPNWRQSVIDGALATPHALGVGDFDGDGDLDVATASYTAFIVRWYENDGHGRFTPHDIDTQNQQQAYDLKVTDLDRDGRMDFILAGRESKNVVWYRNR
ncbi:MAG TPA: VCBS repeat-containing protein [Opitutaceae bacterium]|nr:VCBS repeat-containing protein [Opitutaceae bacterium]